MTDFSKLVGLDPDEVITHSYVRDVRMPSGTTIALITLDNGRDHTRPSTLGPATLLELSGVLDGLKARAAQKEIDGVAVIGKQFIFAAGADLSKVEDIPDRETGVLMAKLGHETLGKLSELGVPSFVFYNGLALGGGVEIGMNADYRTIDSSVRAFALAVACDIHPLNNSSVLARLKSQFGADDAAIGEWYRHWISVGFAALEQQAAARGDSAFAFGEQPTLADICLVPQMANARRFHTDLAPFPRLCAWDERARALPAFAVAAPENQKDAP